MASGGPAPAIAAKAATTTIPIVFLVPEDPVRLGLVASLSRPESNLTGVNFFFGELVAKRLELLRELVPAMANLAVFVNPANPARAEFLVREVELAGRAMGLQVQVFNASTTSELNAAFATFARQRPDVLFVSPDPFFVVRRVQLANLAARYAIPTSFSARDYVEVGGLMSYGTNVDDAYRQVGVYAGRVLKGAKPADLPVVQSSKFELVINAQDRTDARPRNSAVAARPHRRGDRVRRREFITLLGGAAAAWPFAVRAQQGQRVRRLGVLWPGASAPAPPRLKLFREGLREAGYIEGHNLTIELRYSRRGAQYLPELAAELVRLDVEVIQASGDFAPKVAQKATGTIPILAFTDDVLGADLVSSLSRPGGNTTGLTILSPELSVKRLEILSEIVPGLSRVAALWDPTSGNSQVSMTEIAARAKNIQLQVLKVQHRDDLAEAFAAARNAEAQALNIFASPFLSSLSGEIIGVSAAQRLPAIYQWKEHVESGGLVSYGPSLVQLWRQAGTIAAKLLKGAKPADMPVEQPTKFELVVNTRTAKAIGINLSQSLLVRADEVFD